MFRDVFGKDLGRMDEYLNADALEKQFGQSDVYGNTKMNVQNTGKGFPWAMGKDNARSASVQNWSSLHTKKWAKEEKET